MTWYIRGRYQGQTETIDEFDTRPEARRMLEEYLLAYGAGWVLWLTSTKPRDW